MKKEITDNNLVLQNLGIAYFMANRFKDLNMDYEDISQTALLGLVKANSSFNPSSGEAFIVYAFNIIKNELMEVADKLQEYEKNTIYSQDLKLKN